MKRLVLGVILSFLYFSYPAFAKDSPMQVGNLRVILDRSQNKHRVFATLDLPTNSVIDGKFAEKNFTPRIYEKSTADYLHHATLGSSPLYLRDFYCVWTQSGAELKTSQIHIWGIAECVNFDTPLTFQFEFLNKITPALILKTWVKDGIFVSENIVQYQESLPSWIYLTKPSSFTKSSLKAIRAFVTPFWKWENGYFTESKPIWMMLFLFGVLFILGNPLKTLCHYSLTFAFAHVLFSFPFIFHTYAAGLWPTWLILLRDYGMEYSLLFILAAFMLNQACLPQTPRKINRKIKDSYPFLLFIELAAMLALKNTQYLSLDTIGRSGAPSSWAGFNLGIIFSLSFGLGLLFLTAALYERLRTRHHSAFLGVTLIALVYLLAIPPVHFFLPS